MACPLPTLVLHQYSVLLCLGVLPFHYHRPLLALQLHYLCLTVIPRQTFIKETSLEWIEWMCLLWPNLLEHSRWDGIGTKSWLNPPLPFIRRIWIRGSQCKAAITNTFTQRQTFLKWKNIPNNQNPVFGSFNHGRTKWRWKCLGFKLKKKWCWRLTLMGCKLGLAVYYFTLHHSRVLEYPSCPEKRSKCLPLFFFQERRFSANDRWLPQRLSYWRSVVHIACKLYPLSFWWLLSMFKNIPSWIWGITFKDICFNVTVMEPPL